MRSVSAWVLGTAMPRRAPPLVSAGYGVDFRLARGVNVLLHGAAHLRRGRVVGGPHRVCVEAGAAGGGDRQRLVTASAKELVLPSLAECRVEGRGGQRDRREEGEFVPEQHQLVAAHAAGDACGSELVGDRVGCGDLDAEKR